MGIFNIFGKKDASSELTKQSPFKISTEFVPYRLYANKNGATSMMVKVKNTTGETLLTSVVAQLPEKLGFDEVGVSKEREIRIGELPPGDEKEVRFDIHGGLNSEAGEYTLNLTAIAHYRDYGHVINAVKKRTVLNVV